jgi:serine/threonine protein phosphatase 1
VSVAKAYPIMMTEQLAPGRLPPGKRAYAIGDVHGCSDMLDDMHRQIAADLRARPCADAVLIHLGDYIDRGADSAGVIDRIARPPLAIQTINLMGNHEELFLAAFDAERGAADLWMQNGGVPALASWGVPPRTKPRDWPNFIPAHQVTQLRSLALHHTIGSYLFVHAGIRPGIPLAEQTPHDLRWIRKPFLEHDATLDYVVVHGHTVERTPIVRPNRIGIDTGAVLGGQLTCVMLEADRMAFLQV